jgi:hypothetical protein
MTSRFQNPDKYRLINTPSGILKKNYSTFSIRGVKAANLDFSHLSIMRNRGPKILLVFYRLLNDIVFSAYVEGKVRPRTYHDGPEGE